MSGIESGSFVQHKVTGDMAFVTKVGDVEKDGKVERHLWVVWSRDLPKGDTVGIDDSLVHEISESSVIKLL